jgi:hypothetical protein
MQKAPARVVAPTPSSTWVFNVHLYMVACLPPCTTGGGNALAVRRSSLDMSVLRERRSQPTEVRRPRPQKLVNKNGAALYEKVGHLPCLPQARQKPTLRGVHIPRMMLPSRLIRYWHGHRSVPPTLGLDQGRRPGNGNTAPLSKIPMFLSKSLTRAPACLFFGLSASARMTRVHKSPKSRLPEAPSPVSMHADPWSVSAECVYGYCASRRGSHLTQYFRNFVKSARDRENGLGGFEM